MTKNPILIKAQKARYYLKHREKMLAQSKEYAKQNWDSVKETKRKYRQTPKGKLNMYQKSAKVRGYEFNLSSKEFEEIIKTNCHYCGKQNANGVDRKSSANGYLLGNVVACCSTCNYMKGSLSYEDFKEHLKKIITNFLPPSQW